MCWLLPYDLIQFLLWLTHMSRPSRRRQATWETPRPGKCSWTKAISRSPTTTKMGRQVLESTCRNWSRCHGFPREGTSRTVGWNCDSRIGLEMWPMWPSSTWRATNSWARLWAHRIGSRWPWEPDTVYGVRLCRVRGRFDPRSTQTEGVTKQCDQTVWVDDLIKQSELSV